MGRHLAFVDVLGLRHALASADAEVAECKVLRLASVVETTLGNYDGVAAHGATDFFLLWSTTEDAGWQLALATVDVFRSYFDLNETEGIDDVSRTYLLRGGLAYGEVREIARKTGPVSYDLTLGTGLARAYEAQAIGAGMRLFLDERATRYFRPVAHEGGSKFYPSVKVDRTHSDSGEITSREIRWAGVSVDAERRLRPADRLFRRALISWKKGNIPERVVLHYQQTFSAILRAISNPEVLRRHLAYRMNARRYHRFLYPVWATAWLRLFRPKNRDVLLGMRDELWERFLQVSATGGIVSLVSGLNRYNRWRSLQRFLRSGELRMTPRRRTQREA